MTDREVPLDEVRADRRRLLGAIALAASSAMLPAAARAAGEGANPVPAAHPVPSGGALRYRDGWLLAPGDH